MKYWVKFNLFIFCIYCLIGLILNIILDDSSPFSTMLVYFALWMMIYWVFFAFFKEAFIYFFIGALAIMMARFVPLGIQQQVSLWQHPIFDIQDVGHQPLINCVNLRVIKGDYLFSFPENAHDISIANSQIGDSISGYSIEIGNSPLCE
jgi:hypothetical protein